MIEYGFTKSLKDSLETVEEKVRIALKSEGFGVLTRIDILRIRILKLSKEY